MKPGWKKGTTVTFAGEGDEAPGVAPGDVAFVIGEKPHERFTRDGADLVLPLRLSLADALCGTAPEVRTLDGRVLSLPMPEIVTPGYVKTVRGEGMPISGAPGQRGDLLVRCEVRFPTYIPTDNKDKLRKLLSSSAA